MAARRRHPTSEVRAAAERSYPTSEVRGGSRKELSRVRGQGQRLRVPGLDGTGTAERSYPSLRSGAAARRGYPTSEVRGGGWEEQPHVQ